MAILYKANETDFNHLGLGPLDDAVSILVTEERNGMFELEMSYPIEGTRINEIKLDRLIKADAGHNLKGQRFKIIRITKPIDGIVTVNAEHVSYLTQDLALKPMVNYSGSASQALNTWNNNLVDDSPFIVASDITATGSGSWSIKEVKNAREALGGVSGSILETYGGEYLFDNYSIRLMAQRGVNSGTLIAYGRNLVDLTQEESIADTFTSVYPYAVYQDANNKEVLLILPEYFVDSEYVGNYARRKILPVDFSEDEIKDVATLRSRTNSYIKLNGIGIPKVNMQIKYIDLAKTLDYKDLALLEEVNLCDNVFIYFEQLDVNTSAKIIKTVWDDLLEQYDSIEVGEAKSSLSNSINSTVDGKLETIVQRVNTIQLTADGLNVIYRGPEQPAPGNIGDLWYEPDGIYENMYQWDGSIWKLMLSTRDLNSVSEEVKQHTNEIATVTQSANDAVTKADQLIIDAGFIKLDVDQVKLDAIVTASTAQTALSNSGTALTNAQIALDAYYNLEIGGRNLLVNSQYIELLPNDSGWGTSVLMTDEDTPYWHITGTNFISTYQSDVYDWMNANCIVGESYTIGVDIRLPVEGSVIIEQQSANKVIDTANVWKRVFHTFVYVQNYWACTVQYSGTEMDYRNWKLETGNQGTAWTPALEDVQVQITDINGELSRKASQTNFDTLSGTVINQSSLITQTQTDVGLKADKTTVNTLSGTVTTQGTSINANASAIGLKADKTVVDSINGTVNSHSTSITANANAIALKAESSLVNSINGTVSTHTTQIDANSTAINLRLTSAQVDSLVTGKNYVNQTTLNATSSSLNTSITEVSTDLSNLQIGGRNWLLNSNVSLSSNNANLPIGRLVNIGELKGKTITISVDFDVVDKISGDRIGLEFSVRYEDGSISYLGVWKWLSDGESFKGRLSTTFTFKNLAISDNNFVYLYIQVAAEKVYIGNAKIELGNKATDWSPAPEDMATLEKFTTLNATVDGIQTTVGTKASQTQVTQLAGQITTKVESSTYNSKMTQLDSAINLRVQSGDITSAILADKTIKDTRNDNQLPSWYNANYARRSITEFKYRDVMGLPGSSNFVQLTTKSPWTGASGGEIVQVAESPDGTYQRSSTGGLSAWGAWDKVAETGKLISQINISTEGILLQGKRIQLDGDVTMTTAFAEKIKTIDLIADRITTGTLNASKVNIINLNANNISSGTINSITIRGSVIYASEFRQDDSSSANNTLVQILKTGAWFSNTTGALTVQIDKSGIVIGGTATIGSQTRLTNNEIVTQNTFSHNLTTTGAASFQYATFNQQPTMMKGLRFGGTSSEAPTNARTIWFGTIGTVTGLWARQFDSSTVWKRLAFVEEVKYTN